MALAQDNLAEVAYLDLSRFKLVTLAFHQNNWDEQLRELKDHTEICAWMTAIGNGRS